MRFRWFHLAQFSCSLLAFSILTGCNISTPSDESPLLKKLSVSNSGTTVATIYSPGEIDNELMHHAANILAGYLDNNNDGEWDNIDVASELADRSAAIFLFDDELDVEQWLTSLPSELKGELLSSNFVDLTLADIVLCSQPLYQDCFPEGTTVFDASYEEVLHLITSIGYANVYPEIFGEDEDSTVANSMNLARNDKNGLLIDENYCTEDVEQEKMCNWPTDNIAHNSAAWFVYTDPTCDYSCMVSEYTYWSVTSLLGVQSNRTRVSSEWSCLQLELFSDVNHKCNAELSEDGVIATLYGRSATVVDGVFSSGQNPYNLPSTLPFGHYQTNGEAVEWTIESLY